MTGNRQSLLGLRADGWEQARGPWYPSGEAVGGAIGGGVAGGFAFGPIGAFIGMFVGAGIAILSVRYFTAQAVRRAE